MAEHVVKFPVQVITVSPLHIGSGDPNVDHKWFLWDGKKITLLDPDRLLAQVVERGQVAQFERFCLDRQATAADFLSSARIPIPAVAAYTLTCPERPREVLTFIKTMGRPYLPGSSLKGALRSSLLRAYLLQNEAEAMPAATARLEAAVKRRQRLPGQPLEYLLFTGSQAPKDKRGQENPAQTSNYDLLRALGLSDSGRLKPDILRVLPVQVLSSQSNNSLSAKSFTLYPELMTPGWKFSVQMTLDLSFLLEQFGPDRLGLHDRRGWVLNFADHCRAASRNILEQDAEFYRRHHRSGPAAWCQQRLEEMAGFGKNECLLPIGWGSGYDAKTVTDLFEPDLFEQALETYRNTKRLGRPGGRGPWLGADLSPKTRRVTLWKDEETPLGWVKLKA